MNDPNYGHAPLTAVPGPLVSGPFPVSMGDRGAAPTPTETLVFSTSDGSVVELAKRPTPFSATKYSYRYVVDGSDHLVCWDEQLPSGTGGFGFQAALEARWRVASATEVVRRRIAAVSDGEAAVRQAMRDMLWPQTAAYGIERLSALDAFVRSSFCGRPYQLAEGLIVTNLAVRLYLDPVAAEHLRSVKQQEFNRQIAAAQHDTDKAVQGYQAELQTQREQAILAAARGEGGLILMMIAQDPSKMREILAELADRHEVGLSHKRQVLKDLVDADLIQPAEAQSLWQEMNRPTPLFGDTAPTLPAAPAQPQQQLLAGPVAPQSSTPPTPRFQSGGPAATGINAAGRSAIGPATTAPNRSNVTDSAAGRTTGPTPNAARSQPAGANAAGLNTGANAAGPNARTNSGPATTGPTGPTPRFNTGTEPAPRSGSGSGSAATPAPSPGAAHGPQNPAPVAPAESRGSQGSPTDNVVGTVAVGRKNRPNRPGK